MATDMKTQIDEHNTFIDAREGQANHNILTQFKKGLLVQINMQEPFSVADATMLIGAIKASRFPADIQKELETAVECKATKIAVYASSAKGESGKRQELQQIRALKSGGLLTLNSPAPVVAQEPPKPRTLVLGRCPNSGTVSIQPKAEINQEVEVDTAATTDSAVEADDKGDCVTIDSDSDALDAVSKAALKAMEKKLACKKKQAAAKRAAKKAAVKKEKHEAAATVKARPSCATPASPAKKLKVEPIEVTKSNDMKTSMPSLNTNGTTNPIWYKGGAIYGWIMIKSWRVWINKDSYKHKRVPWGAPYPTQDSWEKAYKLLDDEAA